MKRLDHIGIAVRDLDAAVRTYEQGLGLVCSHRETVETEQVQTAFLPIGDTHLELLESLSPDGPIGRFLEKRGEGIHHLCFEVEDLDAALARAKTEGLTPLGEPRLGAQGKRVVFLHPRGARGVLIELCQRPGKQPS
jgi:methylmalonyl-CoA/ethylmalonyl-CoA epimerase